MLRGTRIRGDAHINVNKEKKARILNIIFPF